jgi:ERCC4-related helicase
MDTNNSDFTVIVTNEFEKISKDYNEKTNFLKYHQYITENYLIKEGVRGLLCYYETGYGKTYLSISVSEHYRKLNTGRKIVFLSAKSLASNFQKSLTS